MSSHISTMSCFQVDFAQYKCSPLNYNTILSSLLSFMSPPWTFDSSQLSKLQMLVEIGYVSRILSSKFLYAYHSKFGSIKAPTFSSMYKTMLKDFKKKL